MVGRFLQPALFATWWMETPCVETLRKLAELRLDPPFLVNLMSSRVKWAGLGEPLQYQTLLVPSLNAQQDAPPPQHLNSNQKPDFTLWSAVFHRFLDRTLPRWSRSHVNKNAWPAPFDVPVKFGNTEPTSFSSFFGARHSFRDRRHKERR